MGKDDWCSLKGLKYREKGMYTKEGKSRKLCHFAFWLLSAAIYFTLGGFYIERSGNANWINRKFIVSEKYRKIDFWQKIRPEPYDSCQLPSYIRDSSVSQAEFDSTEFEAIMWCFD